MHELDKDEIDDALLEEDLPRIYDNSPINMAIRLTENHPFYKRRPYLTPPHILLLEKKVMQTIGVSTEGSEEQEGSSKAKNLMLSMPPRHGKSEYISYYLPIWYASRYPQKKIIIVGYSQDFASGFGRRIQDFFSEFAEEMNGILIRKGRNSSKSLILTNGSIMHCVGAGGALTGRGADLIIIDDPIKSSEQAMSPKFRNKLDDWFRTTAFTRIEPGGSCIILMTRWHVDDLIGRISRSKRRAEQFSQLNLPAIANMGDPLGRNPGEALWPDRYPIDQLKMIRLQNGSNWFSAMYQQVPLPPSGAVFRISDFGTYTLSNKVLTTKTIEGAQLDSVFLTRCRIIITCDLAIAGRPESDNSVYMVTAISQDSRIFILHCEIFKGNTLQNKSRLLKLDRMYRPDAIGIESVAFQVQLLDEIRREGLPAIKLESKKSKEIRAELMQPYVEAGSVYLPQEAAWLDQFNQELSLFPSSQHDDIVDAFSYIRQFIGQRGYKPVGSGKRGKSNFLDLSGFRSG